MKKYFGMVLMLVGLSFCYSFAQEPINVDMDNRVVGKSYKVDDRNTRIEDKDGKKTKSTYNSSDSKSIYVDDKNDRRVGEIYKLEENKVLVYNKNGTLIGDAIYYDGTVIVSSREKGMIGKIEFAKEGWENSVAAFFYE